jgi:predicted peroxiredoxin
LAGHALDDGREVVLFMNVRAVDFARRDLSETIAFDGNPPIKKMIAALIGRGARLLVCPHCANVLGVAEGDLIDGARLATRESLFGSLGPDSVVFSY